MLGNIVADLLNWINGILLDVISPIVRILGSFTGHASYTVVTETGTATTIKAQESLFYNILEGISDNVGTDATGTIFQIASAIFIGVVAINIFQEAIRYFTEADVGLDRGVVIKVVRESIGVVAFLVLYYQIFNNIGFDIVSTVAETAGHVTYVASNSFITSVANVSLTPEGGPLPGGAALEFIVMLMAFGLIMGMVNCIAQLVGTFIIGIVGIVIGTLILPIHISLMMLGRGNSAGRALITIINAIVVIGVLLGLGNAIVTNQLAGSFEPNAAGWSANIIKYLIYFGLLEGYKSLVQRANGVMTDMLANLFHLG